MVYGFIYKISFPNGKCYIGLTNRTIEQRWKNHNKSAKSGDIRCLYKALRKYNMIDVFQMIVIDTAETEKELCEKEIAHIEIHNSHYKRGYGYNMTDGGEGILGYSHTDETKEKLRTLSLKQFESTQARQKQSERQVKRFEDPEARLNVSKGLKLYYNNNPEAIQKNSEAIKKSYENPETRQQHREGQRKRRINNPEEGKIHGKKMKNYYNNNQEARRRQSKYEPFDVFKKDGTYIKSFDYQFEAMEYLQTTYKIKTQIKICDVLKGNRNSSHGFTFKYKE